VPEKLQNVIDMFQMFDPADRTTMLLSYADQFKEVPPEIARRPFDKSHQVPQCESDAYVWALKQPDDTMKLYFAVGEPVRASPRRRSRRSSTGHCRDSPRPKSPRSHCDIVERIFRPNISMERAWA
jgi:hypothetical protein